VDPGRGVLLIKITNEIYENALMMLEMQQGARSYCLRKRLGIDRRT
jgi:hypothetical protein